MFLSKFGIESTYEAEKYIFQAKHLLEIGSYTSKNFLFYSTQILLIAACKILALGYWPIVLMQMVLNSVSIFLFYHLILHYTTSNKHAFIYSIFFLLMVYYHLYNVYLFTESLYFSFSIIYTFYVLGIKKLNYQKLIIISFMLSVLFFTRPMGLFFIPTTYLYFIFRFAQKKSIVILFISIPVFAFILYFLLNFALSSGGGYDFQLPYIQKHIICGVPTTQQFYNLNVPGKNNTIESFWYIITNHFNLFIELATKRLFAFFFMVREYYSLGHNIYILVYFLSIYITVAIGIVRSIKYKLPDLIFLLCPIIFTAVTVALSCDEWHNRFMLSVLPFLLILSSTYFWKNPNKEISI